MGHDVSPSNNEKWIKHFGKPVPIQLYQFCTIENASVEVKSLLCLSVRPHFLGR
jgi:hypothetical protein